jgi:Fur family zinc uptake transcriptional regulator
VNINILKEAEVFCKKHKHRLSEPRLLVLKIIASSLKPIGAYEILKMLGNILANPKPPTAYRAIEFWQEHGFIHRIESRNAYIVCGVAHKHKGSQFMICDDCGTATEIHLCNIPKQIADSIAKNTFKLDLWNLEVHGVCSNCLNFVK